PRADFASQDSRRDSAAAGGQSGVSDMKKPLLVVVLATAAFAPAALPAWAAQAVPCETMLKDLRTARETSKPSDADRTKVDELEKKGIERCNADDDKRADDFFQLALKILGH
ncbi:hypothetical protein AB4144_51415, partial [Rhizobiaceae sp. 2RAB30]